MSEETSMNIKITKKISFALRIAITLLLIAFIVIRFVKNTTFDNNDLILIFVIVILVLADSFSSISVGNFLNLKKDVEEAKAKTDKLFDVITKIALTNINNNSNKTEQNTNINIGAQTANDKKENQKKKKEEEKELQQQIPVQRKRITLNEIEKKILEKYRKQNALSKDEIQFERRVNFTSEKYFFCDAYYKKGNTDMFIEIYNVDTALHNISKIQAFANTIENHNFPNRNKACLVLIVFSLEESKEDSARTEIKVSHLREDLDSFIDSNAMELLVYSDF